MEQEIPRRDLSTRSPNVESPIGFKSPSSLLAWLSKMPTPQQDVYMSAIWSDSRNFKSVNNVSATSVTCRSLTFVSPGTIAAPPTVNPYHHYKPNYNSGKHRSVGKDSSTFNIKQAAKVASHRETHKLIDAFMKTGNLEQRRHSLHKFLTHKSIIDDTKHVLQHVKVNKEATAGIHGIRSIKRILKSIFKSSNVGRITNQQRAWSMFYLHVYLVVPIIMMCQHA